MTTDEREIKYCPCCGSKEVYKDPKMAQGVLSCKICSARYLIIVTTKPKADGNKRTDRYIP